jgi:hypothetical protein
MWVEEQQQNREAAQVQSETPQGNNQKAPTLENLLEIEAVDRILLMPPEVPLGTLSAYDPCPVLLQGVPRGLSCLHCTQAEANEQSRVIASILFHSCLENVAINYLVDGTFSYDPYVLRDHVDLLSSNGRRPFLFFYLSNGATQRQWDRTTQNSFGVRVRPEEFRNRILTDRSLQEEFRSIVRRVIPIAEYAIGKGAIVSFIPALEDNLDDTSFQKLFDLTLRELPPALPVAIGRNPCPSCYQGNTIGVPSGLFVEEHTVNPYPNIRDGVVSNDGRDYHFDEYSSGNTDRKLRLEDLKQIRNSSSLMNNTFILWSGKRQGLQNYQPGTTVYPLPSERQYQMPSVQEQAAVLQFLREDLIPDF